MKSPYECGIKLLGFISHEVSNYRGISLLCASLKIPSTIFSERMTPYANEITGEYQGRFRRNRSTIDQIFNNRKILEN